MLLRRLATSKHRSSDVNLLITLFLTQTQIQMHIKNQGTRNLRVSVYGTGTKYYPCSTYSTCTQVVLHRTSDTQRDTAILTSSRNILVDQFQRFNHACRCSYHHPPPQCHHHSRRGTTNKARHGGWSWPQAGMDRPRQDRSNLLS